MVCKQEPPGAKPPLPGLVKLVFRYQNPTASPALFAANVLHGRWLSNTNHPVVDLQTLDAYVHGLWNTNVWHLMSENWSLLSTTAQSLGGDGFEDTYFQTFAGGSVYQACMPQCAVAISWKSGITARGGRARTYVPSVPQNWLTTIAGSALLSANTTALNTAAQTFMNTLNVHTIGGDSLELGVPSYYSQCRLRATPLFYSFYSSAVHDRLDSQRRRSGKESSFPVG